MEVLNSIGLAVHFEYRQFLHVAKAAIKELFHEPTDVFWTGRVMDVLFNGIEIDCDVSTTYAKIACEEIQDRQPDKFKPLDNGKYLFSMFGGVRLEMILENTFFPPIKFNVFCFECSKIIHQVVAGRFIVA